MFTKLWFWPLNLYKIDRKTRVIKNRPHLESQMVKFESDLANYPWPQMFENKTPDELANIFHEFLSNKLDKHLPEKSTKVSNLDRKWFSPAAAQKNIEGILSAQKKQ